MCQSDAWKVSSSYWPSRIYGLGFALRRGPVQIRRGGVGRVAPQDHECFHLPGIESAGQVRQALLLGLGRFLEDDGLAEVSSASFRA